MRSQQSPRPDQTEGRQCQHDSNRSLAARGQRRRSKDFEAQAQEIFGFAGLWDRSRKEDDTWIESCALITMEGNELMQRIHNTGANPFRMPALLTREDREAWLTGTVDEAKAALRQYRRTAW